MGGGCGQAAGEGGGGNPWVCDQDGGAAPDEGEGLCGDLIIVCNQLIMKYFVVCLTMD